MRTVLSVLAATLLAKASAPSALSVSAEQSSASAATETAAQENGSGAFLSQLTPAERFALALETVDSGAAREGLVVLERLLGELEPGELFDRIERERVRVAAWIELRALFLERLAESGEPLTVRASKKRQRVRIERIDGEELVLVPNERGIERLAIDTLDPADLAREMSRMSELGAELGAEWVRVYPYVLRQHGRWKHLLQGDGEPEALLRRDGSEDYPARLRVAEAVERVVELLEGEAPRTPAATRERLDAVREVVAEYAELPLMVRARAGLRAKAVEAARLLFDETVAWRAVQGEAEWVGDERLKLTYEFEVSRELEDFARTEAYDWALAGRRPLVTDVESEVELVEGALRIVGEAGLEGRVELAAPLTVRYQVLFEQLRLTDATWHVSFGICAQGPRSFLWSRNRDGLQVVEDGVWTSVDPKRHRPLSLDSTYELELSHQDGKVELACDGETTAEIDAGERTVGTFFLLVRSDLPVRIGRIEIEGAVTPDSLRGPREAWVADHLADL